MKWMGKNEKNKYAGAGIYFYSLTVNGYTKTKKMVLLKYVYFSVFIIFKMAFEALR